MSDAKRQILEMLEAGTITGEDAERLLEALGDENETDSAPETPMLDSAKELLEAAKSLGKESVEFVKEAASNVKENVKDFVPQLTLHPEQEPVDSDKILGETSVTDTVQKTVKGIFGAAKEAIGSAKQAVSKRSKSDTELTAQGSQKFSCDDLNEINVQWANAGVYLRSWDGDTVCVTEYANRPLEPDECMVAKDDEGALKILWSEQKNENESLNPLRKQLIIELPQQLASLNSLLIHTGSGRIFACDLQTTFDAVTMVTGSGNVLVDDMTADDFFASTGSGSISVDKTKADTMELSSGSGVISLLKVECGEFHAHTGSGPILIGGLQAETVEMESASGDISVDELTGGEDVHLSSTSGRVILRGNELPESAELHSVSGAVTVTFLREPEGGFTVEYDTVAGKFKSDFPLEDAELDKRSGHGTYGDGEREISIVTVSGSMYVQKLYR